MAISYTELPDFNQYIQSYFVDEASLESQEPSKVEVETVTLAKNTTTSIGGNVISSIANPTVAANQTMSQLQLNINQ